MKRKRYSEEQITFALRQGESGTSVAEIIRKMGIAGQTYYRWKKKFAGMGVCPCTTVGTHTLLKQQK